MSRLEEAAATESSGFRAPVGLIVEPSADDPAGDVVLSFPLPTRQPPSLRLTPAEWEVLGDISRGLSNTAIAVRRGVSVRTVANQAGQLFRKLGVHSRLDAMRVAGHWSPPE
jgi:DNA-binding NarL/FixJ family response regulator